MYRHETSSNKFFSVISGAEVVRKEQAELRHSSNIQTKQFAKTGLFKLRQNFPAAQIYVSLLI